MRQREPPSSSEDPKKDDGNRDDSKPHNERYTGRANEAASGNERSRGGSLGLASDMDRQPAWGRRGEYGNEIQGLGVSFASLKASAREGLGAVMNSLRKY